MPNVFIAEMIWVRWKPKKNIVQPVFVKKKILAFLIYFFRENHEISLIFMN